MSLNRMDRRTVLASIASVGVSSALAGCGILGDDGPDGALLWHQHDDGGVGSVEGSETATLEEQIREYRQSNPDADVTVERIDEDYADRLAASLRADQGPESFSLSHRDIGIFQERGLLYEGDEDLPLDVDDEFVAAGAEAARYRPIEDDQGTPGAPGVFGLPFAADTVTVCYNADVVETPPDTADEWLDSVTAHHDGEVDYGLVCPGVPYHLSAWARAFGGQYYDDEQGTVGVADDATVEGLEYYVDEFWPYAPDDPAYDAQFDAFEDEEAAYAIAGPSEYHRLQQGDLDVRTAPFPTLADGSFSPYVDVQLWYFSTVMGRHEEDREDALDVLQWYTTDEAVLETNATRHGFVPVHSAFEDGVPGDDVMSTYAATVRAGAAAPSHPDVSVVWDELEQAFERILADGEGVRDALEAARDEIDDTIDERGG